MRKLLIIAALLLPVAGLNAQSISHIETTKSFGARMARKSAPGRRSSNGGKWTKKILGAYLKINAKY